MAPPPPPGGPPAAAAVRSLSVSRRAAARQRRRSCCALRVGGREQGWGGLSDGLKAKLAADEELQALLKAAGSTRSSTSSSSSTPTATPRSPSRCDAAANGHHPPPLTPATPQFTDGLKDADKWRPETQLDAALKTEDGRAELKALFDSLDANQDGVISVQEWGDGVAKHKDVIAKFFGGATIEEIGRQFARIDADSNKELSWDEMLAAAGIEA